MLDAVRDAAFEDCERRALGLVSIAPITTNRVAKILGIDTRFAAAVMTSIRKNRVVCRRYAGGVRVYYVREKCNV